MAEKLGLRQIRSTTTTMMQAIHADNNVTKNHVSYIRGIAIGLLLASARAPDFYSILLVYIDTTSVPLIVC